MAGLLDSGTGLLIALGAFSVLLPLIVFVHEYGHFKVARLCGVRVEAFSIGFGPALFGWTDRHGTRWKVSAIPLGGYVKFFGDANAASAGAKVGTDLAPAEAETPKGPGSTQFGSERAKLEAMLTEEEKRVCFHFKPVWQRMLVVAAGPFANFVLAAVVFAGLFLAFGRPYTPAVIGDVAPGTPAAEAGFQVQDRVLTVGGRAIDSFEQMQARVRLASGTDLAFEVERTGERVDLVATPRREARTDGFGNEVEIGVLGLVPYVPAAVGVVSPDSPAARAGLQVGDEIEAVDGEPVRSFTALAGLLSPRPGEAVTLSVRRGDRRLALTLTPEPVEVTGPGGETRTVGRIGVGSTGVVQTREPFGPLGAAREGVVEVGRTLDTTVTYLGRLIRGREDVRGLGGPLKIGQYAGQAVRSGFGEAPAEVTLADRLTVSGTNFLRLAALMSVSIGFLNLLPVPVLDGGHLVFYAYEAVAGQPLPERVQGFAFTIGLFLVASLMVFVVVNDILTLS